MPRQRLFLRPKPGQKIMVPGYPFAFKGRGGGASFLPSNLPLQQLWYRADAQSLADNDPVTTLIDSSVNARAATEATNPPVFKTNILNGKPVIRFDGTNDRLNVAAIDWSAWREFTIYAVVSCVSNGNRSLFEFGAAGSAGTFGVWRENLNSVIGMLRGNSGQSEYRHWREMAGGSSDFRLICVRGATDISRQEVWVHIDGYQHGMVTGVAVNSATLGNHASTIGMRSTATQFWQGDLAELIVFADFHGASSYRQVGQYLTDKYALANWDVPAANILFEGDSMTEGGNQYFHNAWVSQMMARTSKRHFWTVTAVSGETIAQMQADREAQITPLYDAGTPINLATFWGGTNDMANVGGSQSAATCLTRQYEHADWLRSQGWDLMFFTMLPRTDASVFGQEAVFESKRQTVNADNRANWTSHADYFFDGALDPRWGDNGDSNDVTYYDVDAVHLNAWGHQVFSDLLEKTFFPLIGESGVNTVNPRDDVSGLMVWLAPDREWTRGVSHYPGNAPIPYEDNSTVAASARDFTQSGGTRRFALSGVLGAQNHAVWTSDGGDCMNSSAALNLSATSAATLFLVVWTVSGDDAVLFELGVDYTAGTNGFAVIHETGNTILAGLRGNVGLCEKRSGTQTGLVLVSAVFDKSKTGAAEVELRLNGSATGVTTVTSSDNGDATTFGNLTAFIGARGPVGSETRLGASGTKWGDILLYSVALSESNRQAIEQQLCAKYGLTWSG